MKFSFLIPIFNFNINKFIFDLHTQSVKSGIDFEILAYDDFSDEKFRLLNREISALDKVHYVELDKNLGRSKIRNLLARNAKSEYLFFFDCDSEITSQDFIKNYLNSVSPQAVVFGGRSYEPDPPAEKNKMLRWHYGKEREFMPAVFRQHNPYRFFMTNNFLIPKDIFLSIKMNEEINGYGHEDTFFAQQLKRNKIPILHIENPLCHIGLEDAEEFLLKTKQGIVNLSFLIKKNMVDEDVKIARYYKLTERFYLKFLVKLIFRVFQKNIISSVKYGTPNLICFDFLKLSWLIKEMEIKRPI